MKISKPAHAFRRAGFGGDVSATQRHGGGDNFETRLLALYPGKRFPTPEDVLATPEELMRAAGLSRAKVAAIKDIAAKTVEGIVPGSREIIKLTNEEIMERLTSVRGVGPWTVEMLLIFTLGRLDVLPATDYGVRKGFARHFRLERSADAKGIVGIRRTLAAASQHSGVVYVAGGGISVK